MQHAESDSKQQALGSIHSKVPVPGTKIQSTALAALLLFGCGLNIAHAGEAGSATQTHDVSNTQPEGKTFAGLKFGTGISASFRRQPIVTNAEVVGGVVRVTEETSAVARVLLETHYLFTCEGSESGRFCGKDSLFKASGHGPFMAIQPGQNDLIQAIGLGWMVAFRHDPKSDSSWNIGIGAMVDPKVKSLGDGIVANQPLPAGETQVRFKTSARYSGFLMTSYSF